MGPLTLHTTIQIRDNDHIFCPNLFTSVWPRHNRYSAEFDVPTALSLNISVVGCETVSLGEHVPTFRQILLTLSSKPRDKAAGAWR